MLVLYTSQRDSVREAMDLIEAGGEGLMALLEADLARIDSEGHCEIQPYEWCQRTRGLLTCLQMVSNYCPEACQKFHKVYKILVGQVVVAVAVLCILQQDYADLLKTTAAINDQNLNFGWESEVRCLLVLESEVCVVRL